jgi:phospholipase A1/A2
MVFMRGNVSFAEGVTFMVKPLSSPIEAGATVTVVIYCVNESTGAVNQLFPRLLSAQLVSASGDVPIQLTLEKGAEADCIIPLGGFAAKNYSYVAQQPVIGPATLVIDSVNQPVESTRPPAESNLSSKKAPEPGKALVAQDRPLFGKFLNDRISTYEPIYFVIGTHPSVAFQFSVKSRLFNHDESDTRFGDFYFGYTQTSYWDLLTSDPSFYDTSYKPSFFLSKTDVQVPGFTDSRTRLDVQYGYEHESNGRGGMDERSLNTLYFMPTLTLGDPEQLHITFQPRVWYYLSVGRYDQNLAAYRGYVNLLTALTYHDFQLTARFGLGDRDSHASTMIDLRVPLTVLHIDPSLQIEYFNGYGQNLRDYDKSDVGLRAGFVLWYPKFDGK